ncbi:MAG: DUF1501 domain-containing protein, partial [Calditrichaeota bacterium]
PFQAVSMTPALPRSLYGEAPALAISNLNDFGVKIPEARKMARTAGKTFETLYEQTSEALLRRAGHNSFEAIKLLSTVNVKSYQAEYGAQYPPSPLGRSLRQIAMLIKAEVGLEVAFTESNGWDTHVQQGTTRGTFARRAEDLARSIAAFWTDLEKYHDRVVLMTMTEFGRTVRENGSGGTDHGRASCLFVLGNGVDGGKVHGEVPELDPDALEDRRDLPVTTDFRAVFAAVAGEHFNIPPTEDARLFPGWTGQRFNLMKG